MGGHRANTLAGPPTASPALIPVEYRVRIIALCLMLETADLLTEGIPLNLRFWRKLHNVAFADIGRFSFFVEIGAV